MFKTPQPPVDDQNVLQHLRTLADAQLVVAVTAEAFAFQHALTREAVYGTLLKRQRMAYHALAAEVLESMYAEEAQLASHAADLAHHYREAANWPKTLEYARRAGEQAQARYAPHEAVEQFTRALEAAAQMGQAPDPRLPSGRGQAFETLGEFERARADYELALRLAREAGDAQAEWQVLLDLGYLWGGNNYARSGDYFQQALALARAGDDTATIARSLNQVGLWLDNIGRAAEGVQRHHEALEIFSALGLPVEIAATHDLLSMAYVMLGDIPASQAQIEQAVELFRQSGDKRGLASSLIGHSSVVTNCDTLPWTGPALPEKRQEAQEAAALSRQIGWLAGQAQMEWLLATMLGQHGEFGEALVRARSALQLATDIEHREWTVAAHFTLGLLLFWLLEPDQAAHQLGLARQLAADLGSGWWTSYLAAFIALTRLQLGQSALAQRELEQAAGNLGLPAGWSRQAPRNTIERYMAWAWGETALAAGQPLEALAAADRLLQSAINPDNKPIPNLLKLKAQALMALGRLAEAGEALDQALGGLPQHPARPVIWQIYRDRGRLARRMGQPEQARRDDQAARDMIEALAATLEMGPLRQNFRARALSQIDG